MTRDQAATEARQAQSQLRAAYERARDPIAQGRVLNELERRALLMEQCVAKTETRK